MCKTIDSGSMINYECKSDCPPLGVTLSDESVGTTKSIR